MKIFFLYIIIMISFTACQIPLPKSNPNDPAPSPTPADDPNFYTGPLTDLEYAKLIGTRFKEYYQIVKKTSFSTGEEEAFNSLILSFDNALIGTQTLGICTTGGNEPPKITLNPDTWTKLRLSAKEQLIFHEYGHCILGRGHLDGTIPSFESDDASSVPLSIMNSYHFSYKIYEGNYFEYLKELFLEVIPDTLYANHSSTYIGLTPTTQISYQASLNSLEIQPQQESEYYDFSGFHCNEN